MVYNSFSILVNNVGGSTRRPIAMETFEQFWSGVEWNLKAVGAMCYLPDAIQLPCC